MPEELPDGRPPGLIGAVDNVLRLLALFDKQKLIRVNEVSRDMGLSRSTVHRMLSTLSHHRFVEQDELSRAYRPGPALVDIGLAVVRNMDLRIMAHGVLNQLAEEAQETSHLAVLRGTDVVFLDSVESSRVVRTGSRIGWIMPAHATAVGKAILAKMSDADVEILLPDEQLQTLTESTVATRSALLKQLADVRKRGYAINNAESESEVSAVAAAICDVNKRVRGALAVTAPKTRVDRSWIADTAAAVVHAADVLGRRFG
ncbi:IclR family transcriptional regulator [Mycobacterium sp. 663a-19]|uniref:IclR family transcriptional regulator n=1 Tax=Mycobacterium sp. 663a-19 TaxID=2986148 RepID=UPI002D1F4F80|nr:IclR family transcriptional regulator [Mycobacterium sp. 663a-19]MEB3980070.1 IclR family transcriptional regulator [Mycobacterium sp. 663a-19]